MAFLAALAVAGAVYGVASQASMVRFRRTLHSTPPSREPRYSVALVTPAYNEAGYIGQLLRSANGQTEPFSAAVVGSSSTDDSDEEASKLGAKIVRIPRGNISLARNVAAAATKSDILVFADADVVLAPTFLEKAVDRLENGAALVHPREVILDAPVYQFVQYAVQVVRPRWNTTRCVAVWREVYDRVGGYDNDCNPITERCREDLNFGRRVAEAYGRRSVEVLGTLVGTTGRRWKAYGLTSWRHFDVPVRSVTRR